jgi:hypothetical protein
MRSVGRPFHGAEHVSIDVTNPVFDLQWRN